MSWILKRDSKGNEIYINTIPLNKVNVKESIMPDLLKGDFQLLDEPLIKKQTA